MTGPTRKEDNVTPLGLYEMLRDYYGDLEWWPADGPFEVMVGAVLTQRTSWRNVEMALLELREAGITDLESLLATPLDRLEVLIQSSGTYRQKARRLRELFLMVDERGDGSIETFLGLPVHVMRRELLAVHGIGPETADTIILYAAHRPVFVVDEYTRRVLGRLEVDAGTSYDQVASWFVEGLPEDTTIFNNYHAALVELAKDHCRKRPICKGCPIRSLCTIG